MIDRLINLLGFGRVSLVDDGEELQRVQVTEGAAGTGFADRVSDDVIRLAEFGFTSNPPIDAEVLLLRRSGDRSQSVVVATSHRPSRRRDLKPGDSAVYDVRGAYVWFTEDGIVIDGAGLPVIVRNTTKLRVEAELLEVTGDVVSRADGAPVSLNALRDAYSAHGHVGVQAGSDTSGLTDHDV